MQPNQADHHTNTAYAIKLYLNIVGVGNVVGGVNFVVLLDAVTVVGLFVAGVKMN